jgi:hypothetical protein
MTFLTEDGDTQIAGRERKRMAAPRTRRLLQGNCDGSAYA